MVMSEETHLKYHMEEHRKCKQELADLKQLVRDMRVMQRTDAVDIDTLQRLIELENQADEAIKEE